MSKRKWQLRSVSVVLVVAFFALSGVIQAQIQSTSTFRARDPGVQNERPGTGRPIGGLTIDEREMFDVGLEDFAEEEDVPDGVGPRFNFVGCAGCHSQPAVGGTSPALNPLFRVIGELGFTRNVIPSFIKLDGPIREARFQFNPRRKPRWWRPCPLRDQRAPASPRLQYPAGGLRETGPQQQHHLPDSHAGPRRRADRAGHRHFDLDRGVTAERGHPRAARAWRPRSPQSSTSKSDSPLITFGISLKPGAAFT